MRTTLRKQLIELRALGHKLCTYEQQICVIEENIQRISSNCETICERLLELQLIDRLIQIEARE